MRFAPHKLPWASRRVIALLAVAGSLGVVTAVVLASNLTRSGGPVACSYSGMPRGADPLPGGRRATVAGAQSAAGFPVLVPHDLALSPAHATHVWVSNQAVAFSYARGKITITMTPAAYADPLTWFHTFIAENHYVAAAIGQVNGQPALVITPDTDSCGGNPAWVEFDHGGVDIDLSSHDYGTTTLLAVADSMRPDIPWRPAHLPARQIAAPRHLA
jgi:hypothetical protein